MQLADLAQLCDAGRPARPEVPADDAAARASGAGEREHLRLGAPRGRSSSITPTTRSSPIAELVAEAADDPAVLAIKQTLYRTSGDSPVVAALTRAAENGKQVTAVIELRARFDEERNLEWAQRLEQAGAHVVYGLLGLKTHCKALLVVRREKDGIRRYLHLGTGNYNDATARVYTDLGLLTCDERARRRRLGALQRHHRRHAAAGLEQGGDVARPACAAGCCTSSSARSTRSARAQPRPHHRQDELARRRAR